VAGNPLLVVSPGGKSPPIFVQLIFLVSYNGAGNRRRRRATSTPWEDIAGRPREDQAADERELTLTNQAPEFAYGQAAVGTSLRIDEDQRYAMQGPGQGQADFASSGNARPAPTLITYLLYMIIAAALLSCCL
jgi:hypothetical protein